jgi:hypothetical protein
MSPPGNPSHHASVSASGSASVSKTDEEEPGWIPIHLGTFGSSPAVAPGPAGRQIPLPPRPPTVIRRQQRLRRQTHALFPFASSRLRVRPSGLNPRSMAAKITERRKRTLFPPDETAEPTHPRRTMSPPGNPTPHASGSASGSGSASKTHEEEPGWIPIHLGTFGPSQAVAPGPEARQIPCYFLPSPVPFTPEALKPLARGAQRPRGLRRLE